MCTNLKLSQGSSFVKFFNYVQILPGPDPEMLLPGGTESRSLEPSRHGVIKKVIVINCNLITFSKIIECNCN